LTNIIKVTILISFSNLADDNIVPAYLNTRLDKAIKIELIICSALLPGSLPALEIRNTEDFITLLTIIIGTEEDRPEETSINCALVQHNGVFLVVASIACDSDD
jgi:hypothetical protein